MLLLQDKGIHVFTELGIRYEVYQSLGVNVPSQVCRLWCGILWGRRKKSSEIGMGERDVRKNGTHAEKEAQRGGERLQKNTKYIWEMINTLKSGISAALCPSGMGGGTSIWEWPLGAGTPGIHGGNLTLLLPPQRGWRRLCWPWAEGTLLPGLAAAGWLHAGCFPRMQQSN